MATDTAYREVLVKGAAQLGLTLSEHETDRLLAFRELLEKWNKAYNLTSVRDPAQMIGRHLLDSLSIAPWVTATDLLDVGSGGGLPVLPLAIIMPGTRFVALDSNSKKTRFLTQCKLELGLDNVEVVHARAEDFQPAQRFSQVSSRAFTAIANMVRWCGPLLAEEGEFLAMKGPEWIAELSDVPTAWYLAADHGLQVPGCEGQHHLLIIRRSGTHG
ncbi:16S rRNA (guanine(527)-N(7))-methyltransferase RsmG [Hydrocarboniclastica marina]|uniref:Ribosomal RNA small subunit methyltransferase G n=1 Tax=Hydrocarboniclastica marina TaxID=2259620 RepID=A0A4P7XKV8_9ALTE|nr:16S rRNA (guanine(527)-N(7))-methyltransferase RsmG [Hydrocarboniclastica marina]MAM00449.1 16S rRNA (guanine(527)-N(7))-methyltransferase RsmG [Alteromonadaceae bacterium]QCF27708.1 16S rRNA (guanine(527)-N(7))-methyltransferase RsmG [Hydrocarboniclastica marina]|tara:strand:+ start:2985 stop:3632 length:648 start_codon:yes stop_codon:yes gene_type:complete